MSTIIDVVKAINAKLKANFKDITIQSTDVIEGYNRPCFYVDLVSCDSELMNEDIERRTLGIRILYFPSDREKNRVELFKMIEQLQSVFLGYLTVKESFNVHVLETSSAIDDGVLIFTISLDYYMRKAIGDDGQEYMEILDINL